jgi:hypothetical protein
VTVPPLAPPTSPATGSPTTGIPTVDDMHLIAVSGLVGTVDA